MASLRTLTSWYAPMERIHPSDGWLGLGVDDFLSVFSGGACTNDPLCGDIDFNNDGLFPDTLDIDALLSIFSGGACLV